jgi:hypothetical protein
MRRVAEWCAELELAGGAGDANKTTKLVQEVAAALDAAQQELTQRLGKDVVPAGGTAA